MQKYFSRAPAYSETLGTRGKIKGKTGPKSDVGKHPPTLLGVCRSSAPEIPASRFARRLSKFVVSPGMRRYHWELGAAHRPRIIAFGDRIAHRESRRKRAVRRGLTRLFFGKSRRLARAVAERRVRTSKTSKFILLYHIRTVLSSMRARFLSSALPRSAKRGKISDVCACGANDACRKRQMMFCGFAAK